jgi:hypothetical protein
VLFLFADAEAGEMRLWFAFGRVFEGERCRGDYQGEAKESVEICEICGYNFFEPGFPLARE